MDSNAKTPCCEAVADLREDGRLECAECGREFQAAYYESVRGKLVPVLREIRA